MQIGIDSFVGSPLDLATGKRGSDVQRVRDLLEEVQLADEVGLDVFGIGEHHRQDFIASAPAVLLAAAAARTKNIRLASAVTVLSSDDPVRVFQDFATLDLISGGRAEIIVGRGSFIESYPLFGFDLKDYDALFTEKLDLLLKLRESTYVTWSGKHRAPLTGQGVFPRPLQKPLPVYIGVGGTPNSFVRAGKLGLPLVVAIIGGEPQRFRPLIELYREAGQQAGHAAERLTVGIHSIGFVGDSNQEAADDLWPSHSYMFSKIGKERGWPPQTRAQYNMGLQPQNALLVGDAETVAEKILYENRVLGGISRMTMMLSGGPIAHGRVMRSIELLGTRVAPIVRKELAQAVPSGALEPAFSTRT
jgi:probable LLM family oxidoreductase